MTPIEQEIEGIVDSILEDYRHGRDIDKLDPFQHPDKAVVIDMIGKLLRIVYPGSSRDKTYRIYNTKHNLSMLIEDVMYNLNKQIAIALRAAMPEQEAQEKALAQQQQKAATLAAYGDFSGYGALGYTPGEIQGMTDAYARENTQDNTYGGLSSYAKTLLDVYRANKGYDIRGGLQQALDSGLITQQDYLAALQAAAGMNS